ncbi:hypothetical protein JAAARDRAFT_59046 [Jaapia argillacea MUCL 33604]|uniref:DNA 3'-5' helicase n=1 Tax=Jaapia argillacea MUCL 33604 TaxID=933084 RepID=A0A067PZW4_9AGAM|nr:hypothetical protein JAAARDRAFT_59046 [Jaapia argillacea MUCL 33604]
MPIGKPIHAFSATLSPQALEDVCEKLNIDLEESFYLNLGNDRPNIATAVVEMNSINDLLALNPLLTDNVTSADDLKKMMVFVNTIELTHTLCRHIRGQLPQQLKKNVAVFHAQMSKRLKARVLRRFCKGKIKILVSTEAAGMGADIPDVEQVIQFGVPSSLSVWLQCAGRAGRSPDIQA